MPTEVLAQPIWNRRTLRVGIGVTITCLVALWFNWTLAYLAPIFALPMLQGSAMPTSRAMVGLLFATFVIFLASLLVGGVARIFPIPFLLMLFAALFLSFRAHERGGPDVILVLILCGLMLMPMTEKISWDRSWEVAASFFWNIGLSLIVTVAMFAVLPPLPTEPVPSLKVRPSPAGANRRAALMTLVTGSYALAYFSFGWTNVHTPIYIAIFIQHLALVRDLKITVAFLAANIAGGLVAMILYELIAMTPLFLFMAVLMLAVNLVLARLITSGTRLAPLAGAATSVMFILLGGAMAPYDENASSGVADRLGEIGMAAIYAIAALKLLEPLLPAGPSAPETTTSAHEESVRKS